MHLVMMTGELFFSYFIDWRMEQFGKPKNGAICMSLFYMYF